MTAVASFRLTQYARGGGCACKIPPGELEETVNKLVPDGPTERLLGELSLTGKVQFVSGISDEDLHTMTVANPRRILEGCDPY